MMNVIATFFILTVWLNDVSALTKYFMDQHCGETLDLSDKEAIRLKLTSKNVYQPNFNCSLLITSAKQADEFMLYFKDFDIVSSSGCSRDWLEVHDGTSETSPYVAGLPGNLCGSSMSNTVRTTVSSNLYLHFESGSSVQRKGFDMVITQFHTGACYSSEYSCGNGRCISDSLLCNGYNPCGDYSDCVVVVLAAGIIVAIVFGSVVFCFAMVCCVIICCRRRRRRHINRGIYQPVIVTTTTGYGTGYN